MKHNIEKLLQQTVKQLQETGTLPASQALIIVEATKDKQHGDFASNIALILAKSANKKPRDIATLIINNLPISKNIQKIEIAGPGFINFFLAPLALIEIVAQILTLKGNFGCSKIGREKKVLVEFVSSNPTGPLHVGHGRHAALGAVVANLLDAVGFKTYREYYVNDAGRQMDILAVSIWLRYLTLCGEIISFPANGYRGEYVMEIAQAILQQHEEAFLKPAALIYQDLPPDEEQGGNKEAYIDALVKQSQTLLGEKYQLLFDFGLASILKDIHDDLAEFGVHFDNWFSERAHITSKAVEECLLKLKINDFSYEYEGAIWFRSTQFGDEKDRVLVRSNGTCTYFANDVAYHLSKFERNFDIAIDIFGSDHHGYVPRMKAAMQACDINPERLVYLLVQFVTLYRNGQQVQMSTRGGNFVTLRALRNEVGNDVARFFYVMRKHEQHMDFDLDLAKKQSNENPVFYVQYAYARICSVLKQLKERQIDFKEAEGLQNLQHLSEPQERELLNTLSRYPDMIVEAAIHYEPHQLTNYMRELATNFHAYYNSHQFIVEDSALRNARLTLVMAVRQTLLNGFNLLGITAPQSM